MRRLFATVAMAAAALATLGLAGPSVASAGASSQAAATHIGKTYSKGLAGYQMIGNGSRFRYLKATLTVPDPYQSTRPSHLVLWNSQDAISLWSYGAHAGYALSSWDYGGQEFLLTPQIQIGDRLTLGVYVDRNAGTATITAVDLTSGASDSAVVRPKALDYTQAWVTAFGPTWNFAPTDTRLWAFQDIQLTTTSGYRGTIFGPWATNRVIGTRGGTPTGAMVLWPTYPWNNGHNFSVMWRAAS